MHPEWSDLEEEEDEDLNEQEEKEKQEEEVWESTIQKQEEEKEGELKLSNRTISKLDPEAIFLPKPKIQKCIPHSLPILW